MSIKECQDLYRSLDSKYNEGNPCELIAPNAENFLFIGITRPVMIQVTCNSTTTVELRIYGSPSVKAAIQKAANEGVRQPKSTEQHGHTFTFEFIQGNIMDEVDEFFAEDDEIKKNNESEETEETEETKETEETGETHQKPDERFAETT